ncbi:hypothetical protein RV02_GL002608 [Enterococcus gilvus]|nr:hypothetical protein RV02_GL002608 [Enterococcus gilvus]
MKKLSHWLYRQPKHIIYRIALLFCLLFWAIVFVLVKQVFF